jgi:hypothetical protein
MSLGEEMGWLGRWFWSPVGANENSAQTLLRVLGNLLRTGLTLFVLLIAFMLVAILLHDAAARERLKAKEAAFKDLTIIIRPAIQSDEARDLILQISEHRRENLAESKVTAQVYQEDHPSFVWSENGFHLQCGEAYPIAVYIANRSKLVLERATIYLDARAAESSVNVLNNRDRRIQWDSYVPPGHALVDCYALETLNRDLIYSGNINLNSVSFIDPKDSISAQTNAWLIR